MARTIRSMVRTTLVFFFLFIISVSGGNQDDMLIRSLGSSAMILPLFRSTPNSSEQQLPISFRRQLKMLQSRHPNARMRLYDDLLSNGYYTTRLLIGTPPQEFALIVDSGSTVTYVPCSTCEQCGKHQDPRFQPDLSSTYQPVKCSTDCTCNSDRTQCIYERQYAEMSSSSGVLGEDIVSFGSGSALKPQRAVFGCENEETGDLYSQRADGIIGLGSGQLSILDQLVDKGVIADSFSLCYGGMDVGGGVMILGGISPPTEMVFTHSDPVRSPYYNIDLKEIHVAGKSLKLNPDIFNKKHGTVLDSGTTYAYLPEEAFLAFKDAITENLNHLKPIRGPDPTYNDICFSGAGSVVPELSKTFPKVEMVFESGKKLSLAPENYLFKHSKHPGAYCLGIFQNGKDPTTLLGGIIVRNTLVTYDRENEKVGFFKTNCSVLWDNVHILGANSTESSSNHLKNSTTGYPPTMAPSGLPVNNNFNPGKVKIGIIIFDMSLSIKYSDLVPHIRELAEFIAQDLEVNTSQVHLLNFTARGNETLMRCSIHPMGSAQYISNITAMKIIDRLTEHRFQLPGVFENSKLVEWKIEPLRKRAKLVKFVLRNLQLLECITADLCNTCISFYVFQTIAYIWPWWRKYSALLLGGVAVMVLSFATLGMWFVWRQRQQQALGSYKPVAAIVPEQELQKL
ncbi:hypothetical protein IFM89_007916 [Coptis chinensis]|uniref:Peptidase A1 domain-containing protein n=1 Tax=Coptis chinensis TaxID=261450 RepID=A0A835III5_9MAGN|nr:hypothetical protein IFM89_007916 [Coptis chinensis]